MGTLKFVHCADIHLDSPMRGLARYDGAPVEQLRGATRRAFERLVGLAIDEGVAFVVIAGDLYDGDRDDYHTAMFLQRQLRALQEAGIAVAVVYGNHDAANEITKRLALPANTYAFPSDLPATHTLQDVGVALHGRSYPTRAVSEDLSARYPQPVPGLLNVGVLHTSVDGRPGHDPYAPCTIDGLANRGYQYWALGHVHKRESYQRHGVRIVFPGNLQGRDVGESGSKGASLVEYDDSGIHRVEHRDLHAVRWDRVEVHLEEPATPDDALEAVLSRLQALQADHEAELHAVRVVLAAGPALSRNWLRDADRFEAQLRADAAAGSDRVWLERIELRPTAVRSGEVPDEALSALREALDAVRSGTSQQLRAEITGLLGRLRSRFGPDAGQVAQLGGEILVEDNLSALLDEVESLLVAELDGGA